MSGSPRVFYFGCWEQAGHYSFAPGGASVRYPLSERIERYGKDRVHLDGSLAPRRMKPYYGGGMTFVGSGDTEEKRRRIGYDSEEFPQGQFMRHVLDNGFTAIQWWDRQQGDSRGACNSTILMEGERTTEEMLAAAREHFPHVLERLEKAGITLVEVGVP